LPSCNNASDLKPLPRSVAPRGEYDVLDKSAYIIIRAKKGAIDSVHFAKKLDAKFHWD